MANPPVFSIMNRFTPKAALYRAMAGLSLREQCMEEAINFICASGVEGDFLEFGTYRGASLIQAYWAQRTFVEHHRWSGGTARLSPQMLSRETFKEFVHIITARRFIAFDSFEGLPDAVRPEETPLGAEDYACSLDEFMANLQENQVDIEKVQTVQGWFEKTLTQQTTKDLNLTAAALVHVDCDLYEPACQVLEYVTDLLVDGTVIIFDDWDLFKAHPNRGERRAFREWREAHPTVELSPFRGNNSFVVHR